MVDIQVYDSEAVQEFFSQCDNEPDPAINAFEESFERAEVKDKLKLHFHANKPCIDSNCSTSKEFQSLYRSHTSDCVTNGRIIENEDEAENQIPDSILSLFQPEKQCRSQMPAELDLSVFFRLFMRRTEEEVPVEGPRHWVNPYLFKNKLQTRKIPNNHSSWKYCFEENYYCEITKISKKSKTKNATDTEVAANCSTKALPCPECFKNVEPSRLMEHIREHVWMAVCHPYSSNRDYNVCRHCFTLKRTRVELIKHHMMVMNQVSRYCCMVCNSSFVTEDQRMEHMNKLHHRYTMPYVCPICPYRCSTAYHIKKHFTAEHRQSAICPLCLKVFFSVENHFESKFESEADRQSAIDGIIKSIYQHMEQHYALSFLYSCKRCQLTFLSKAELHNHKRQVHSDGANAGKPPAGYQLLPIILWKPLKMTVQKYKTREELDKVAKISASKEVEHLSDERLDKVLLKFIHRKEQAISKTAAALQTTLEEKWRDYAEPAVITPTRDEANFANDTKEYDFADCYFTKNIFLKKPENESEKIQCEECLEPWSKNAPDSESHFSDEQLSCNFPGCCFRTFCIYAHMMHNHEAMGTRKEPRVLFNPKYLEMDPKTRLWICTNCAMYFTDIRAMAFHQHEKGHIGYDRKLGQDDDEVPEASLAQSSDNSRSSSS